MNETSDFPNSKTGSTPTDRKRSNPSNSYGIENGTKMRNPSFQSYVSATIGALFSETEKAVAQTKSKLGTGLPLHSGDIARIERTYYEEWFDAKAFRPFVCSNAYKF